MQLPPTERFGRRVNAYAQGRPTYPSEVFEALLRVVPAGCQVIDLGAGTGIFTKGLLIAGYQVLAIEPNEPMRASIPASERLTTMDGQAERIPAADASADLVTAAQAAHWFHAEAAAREIRRVLRPGGWVAFVWNERVNEGVGAAYQSVVDRFKHHEPGARDGSQPLPAMDLYFRGGTPEPLVFDNPQAMDYDGFIARAASSSYLPHPGDDAFESMVVALLSVFEEYAMDGILTMPQESRLILGQVAN